MSPGREPTFLDQLNKLSERVHVFQEKFQGRTPKFLLDRGSPEYTK